jgi:hypothetical protein
MCLDDKAGVGRDGQPVQLWKCLGNRNQAYVPSVRGPGALIMAWFGRQAS